MVLVQEQRGREKDDNFKAFSWDMQTIRKFKRYKRQCKLMSYHGGFSSGCCEFSGV